MGGEERLSKTLKASPEPPKASSKPPPCLPKVSPEPPPKLPKASPKPLQSPPLASSKLTVRPIRPYGAVRLRTGKTEIQRVQTGRTVQAIRSALGSPNSPVRCGPYLRGFHQVPSSSESEMVTRSLVPNLLHRARAKTTVRS